MQNINSESYAKFKGFAGIPYTCYKYLIENEQMIWKLIKYNTPNAWDMPDLTVDEKRALIYAGQDDLTKARAFYSTKLPDVWTDEICIVRIAPYSIFPENRVIGTISILLDVYCHWKIDHLNNYQTRTDMIIERFFDLFNGKEGICGIGKMFFDRAASESNRSELGGQIPFGGKWIVMSVKSN